MNPTHVSGVANPRPLLLGATLIAALAVACESEDTDDAATSTTGTTSNGSATT